MLRPSFKNETSELFFEENGYFIGKKFLNSIEIAKLIEIFNSSCSFKLVKNAMYFSSVDEKIEQTIEISDKIKNIIENKLIDHFQNYRVDLYTIASKRITDSGYMGLHRDFTITDEYKFQYRNIWIPLVDVNSLNGGIFVLPKHIYWEQNQRWPHVDNNIQNQYEKYDKGIIPVSLKAGDILVYAEKTLHGSFPNKSNDERPVIHFGLLNNQIEFFRAKKNDLGKIEIVKTSFESLLKN